MELHEYIVIIQTVFSILGILSFFTVLFASLYKWIKRKPLSAIIGWCTSFPAFFGVLASIPYLAELNDFLNDYGADIVFPDIGLQYYIVLLSIGMGLTVILGVVVILLSKMTHKK